MAENEADAKRVYHSLSNALDKFLKNVVLEYAGFIPFDRELQKAVRNRRILLDSSSDSLGGKAMSALADRLIRSEVKTHAQGNLTFFMNRVFEAVE